VILVAAAAAGRGDREIPAALRANVAPGTPVDEIARAVVSVAEGTGIRDIFVDLMYLARDLDEAADLAGQLLAAVARTS
jgi:hypothetical protein